MPASPIASLVLALRIAEPDGVDVGRQLAEQHVVLAPLLGVSAAALRAADGLRNAEIVPELARLLQRRGEQLERRRRVGAEMRAFAAAALLARSARFAGDQVHMDVRVLLGALLADKSKRYVSFSRGWFTVAVARRKLAEVARVLGKYPGLVAFIDSAGLHMRWRDGRGGLNLTPRHVSHADPGDVLEVVFSRDWRVD